MNNTHDISQTAELVTALATVTKDIAEHGDDSKTRLLLSLIRDGDKILKGILGIQEVPAELKDLQSEERLALYAVIEDSVGGVFDDDTRAAVRASVTAAFTLAESVRLWRVVIAQQGGAA